ncbi:ABC transporter permease [Raineyella fluvialis]|uniref:ABC transporter permease subunit n=1 Tax=Raineyella fluvialis TaxID=2662261 RepID=A0A5Q2F935_9ACTN|nr:ABC transporter permease [Raineyella fluvialis]QGF22961.1 ABC transporter permease subunit [Raineyella fluvialis]
MSVAEVGAWGRLLRSELGLTLGRRRNQFGLLVLAALPVMIAVTIKVSGSHGGHGPDFFSAITSNGIFVALAALSVELTLFLPLAIAVLAGDAIAGEAGLGTLRYLLAVPVPRTRLLLTKYVALVIGALEAAGIVALAGVVAGGLAFGLPAMTTLSGSTIGMPAATGRLILAVLYIAAGLAALAAIGLFISTLTEQPIVAMVATTAVAALLWILDAIPQLGWLHPWLLVHHWLAFGDLFRDPIFGQGMVRGLWLALGYTVVFLVAARTVFVRRDVTS